MGRKNNLMKNLNSTEVIHEQPLSRIPVCMFVSYTLFIYEQNVIHCFSLNWALLLSQMTVIIENLVAINGYGQSAL